MFVSFVNFVIPPYFFLPLVSVALNSWKRQFKEEQNYIDCLASAFIQLKGEEPANRQLSKFNQQLENWAVTPPKSFCYFDYIEDNFMKTLRMLISQASDFKKLAKPLLYYVPLGAMYATSSGNLVVPHSSS
jgi:hypothetical protein